MYPSEPSRLSRLHEHKAGASSPEAAQVARMAHTEAEKRLRQEKDELMARLHEHGSVMLF